MRPTHGKPVRLALPTILLAVASAMAAVQVGRATWDFEADEPGAIAGGFTNEVGRWEVAVDGGNRVLAQRAENGDRVFNLALVDRTSYRDLDLSVRVKA